MDVVTVVMGRLLPKLGELLVGEYKLQKGVKEDIESLEREMNAVHAALTEVAQVPWGQLGKQVKNWANELRELSYDMEDVVDNFLVCVEGSDPAANSNKLKWLMEKMTSMFTKGNSRHQIANDIKAITNRAKEVAGRHDRYKVVSDAVANAASNSGPDPRMLALYKDQKELVGIEGAQDELTKRLTHGEGDVSNQQLKIVSIVGPGGLGKTTLAKAVYDSLQTQFKCKAFVPVGRNPNVHKVLKAILLELQLQLGKSMGDIATLDETQVKQLIDKLQDLLQDKRYFIVIDDIWDLESWQYIKCALLDNNHGSRVITTTRIHEVAAKTGDVYKLEPLSHDLSEKLFFTRLFGGKDKCPYDQPSQVSKKILQKCGGVPLAIIAIASLLVDKRMEDWSTVYTSIGFKNGDNNKDIDNMRKILVFSYDDLPCHLRPCLLHLSIFPEDTLIMKDTLIWMWVAEGFVSEKPRIGLFEIGEGYFNDLVNRSMILPVEHKEKNVIYACRVHDMVLDTICWSSEEQNFVTILDSDGKYSSSQRNARRLAVQIRDEEQHNHLADTSMPKLRSFYANMCGTPTSMMPPLSSFQVLRVLDMGSCRSLENCHLKHLGRLHQLRYLSLENTYISELPKDIGDLKFLQILDLRDSEIKELPQGTSLLRRLKRLRVDGKRRRWRGEDFGIIVRNWIGNLTSLEELYLNITGEFSTFVEELGKLTELRVLICHLSGHLDDCSKKTLVDSVCKLRKIQILRLKGFYGRSELEADNWERYEPPRQLRDLYISGDFSRLPAWINSSQLPNLSQLKMQVYHMEKQYVVNLWGLPELLKMKYIWIPAGMEFPDGAFPKLRSCGIDAPFRFLQGSMQSLESITFGTMWYLRDAVIDFDFIGTLGNLPSLQMVFAYIDCGGARASDVEEMEAAVRQAIDTHPNRPTLHLNRRGQHGMIEEPASPLHHTTSVGTSAQIIVEDAEDEESNSQQTEQEFHDDDDNRVREEPDPEQRNQDQSHDDEASDSRKADQQPDDERKANDVDVDAAEKCSVLDVHPNRPVPRLSVGMSAPSPARTTTTGVSTSAQAINEEEEEEEESQADRQEQPADEREEAEDGSAEVAAPESLRTVDVASLAESGEAAAGKPAPVPARRTWRRWACFSCLNSGSSSSD